MDQKMIRFLILFNILFLILCNSEKQNAFNQESFKLKILKMTEFKKKNPRDQVNFINSLPKEDRIFLFSEYIKEEEFSVPPHDTIKFLGDGRVIITTNGYKGNEYSIVYWKLEKNIRIWKKNRKISFPIDEIEIWDNIIAIESETEKSLEFEISFPNSKNTDQYLIHKKYGSTLKFFDEKKFKKIY